MTSFEDWASPFEAAGVLSPAEVQAVRITAPRFGETDGQRMLGLAFAMRAPRLGHAGVALADVRERVDEELALRRLAADGKPVELVWPLAGESWATAVRLSPMVAEDGENPAESDRPFVAQRLRDGTDLLSTRRMYALQRRLAAELTARAREPVHAGGLPADLAHKIEALFIDPEGANRESVHAAKVAARERLAIVTGGPGTGKTYLVKRLLAALLALEAPGARPLVIELAAPTGKAGVRMLEALREDIDALDVRDDVKARLRGLQARTLHRLLGVRPDGGSRHDANNRLEFDILIVDEVSMVDLVMMRRLLDATPKDARLVLLGDRDQLASVEAGSVLADLVRAVLANEKDAPLANNIAELTVPRRYKDAPAIGAVAADLRGLSDAGLPAALAVMMRGAHEGAPGSMVHLGVPVAPREGKALAPSLAHLAALATPYTHGFTLFGGKDAGKHRPGYVELLRAHIKAGRALGSLAKLETQRMILDAFESYRVLAAHRRGPMGVVELDQAIGGAVHNAILKNGYTTTKLDADGPHWLGRPILVTENAYDVDLMNGDVGLVLVDARGRLAAAFASKDDKTLVRHVPLSRLPPHEGALAMTVHKSQGSQYERVALVLAGRDSSIQTRELIYTAVTRAKDQLAWLGDPAELERALKRRVTRASALADML